MRRIPLCSVSIVSLFFAEFLPFLFTAYAVLTFQPWFIAGICFFSSCLLSFMTAGISSAFSSAGWLMCGLILIASRVTAMVLLLLWLSHFSGRNIPWLLTIACSIDTDYVVFSIISPFLACLIEF
jgi:hypothetical protein